MAIRPIGTPEQQVYDGICLWFMDVYGLWMQHVVVCQPWNSCIYGLDYIYINMICG